MRVAAVVPAYNGARWLEPCLDALLGQVGRSFERVLVVDGGSADGSRALVGAYGDPVRLIDLPGNPGFAAAANRGWAEAAGCAAVAMVNTDVVLDPDWLARCAGALEGFPAAASVAVKMVSLQDPGEIDDAGDFLRRDAVAEQRGRFRRDEGRWDEPEEVWGPCAGAALYRRGAVLEVGGWDERYGSYLEDVDLALRLRLGGWTCRYEPAVARHAGGGSAGERRRPPAWWVERNRVLLAVKAFPVRWLAGPVLYRQVAHARVAAREGRLGSHLHALASALPLLPGTLRARRELRRRARVPIAEAVPHRPWRGARAGGHPESPD